MANGLFNTPQQVNAAEQHRQGQQFVQQGLGAGIFNLGDAFGDAIGRAVGGDPRSVAVKRATQLQDIAKGIDMTTGQGLTQGAQRLSSAGFQNEALQLMQMVPTPTKPVELWGPRQTRKIRVANDDGSFVVKEQEFQVSTRGQIRELGNVTNRAPDNDSGKSAVRLDQSWTKPVVFGDNSQQSILNRISNLDDFKGFGILTDPTDPESFKILTGDLQRMANELKAQDRGLVTSKFNATGNEQELAFSVAEAPDHYLNEAYKLWIQSNAPKLSSEDTATGLGGDKIALDPLKIPTAEGSAAQVAQENKRREAVANVALRTGQLVSTLKDPKGRDRLNKKGGNPNTKQFVLSQLEPVQAQALFSNMDKKSDDDMVQAMINEGFEFTPELAAVHAQRWQLMRENPDAVNLWFSTQNTPSSTLNPNASSDLRDASIARSQNILYDSNNAAQYFANAGVYAYLRRLSDKKKKKSAGSRGRGATR